MVFPVPLAVGLKLLKEVAITSANDAPEPENSVAVIVPLTSNAVAGLVVPIPTFPESIILIASVAPLLPTWKITASVVPTPEVDLRVNVEVARAPPITNGSVIEVVKIGDVPNTIAPLPVSSDIIPDIPPEVVNAENVEPLEDTIPLRAFTIGSVSV
jgi:hypothetical protein